MRKKRREKKKLKRERKMEVREVAEE